MSENQDDMARRLREARMAAGYLGPSDAARALGVPEPTYLGHENGSRGYRAQASRYAAFFRVNLEWLLTGRGEMKSGVTAAPAPAPAKSGTDEALPSEIYPRGMPLDLPVHGAAEGGEEGQFDFNDGPVDWVRRPPRLAGVPTAYGLYVSGNSMSPWKVHGELIFIHPGLPVRIGDYVVIELVPAHPGEAGPAFVKRLVRRTPSDWIVAQFEPKKERSFPIKKVSKIHRVMTNNELFAV